MNNQINYTGARHELLASAGDYVYTVADRFLRSDGGQMFGNNTRALRDLFRAGLIEPVESGAEYYRDRPVQLTVFGVETLARWNRRRRDNGS